jgi:hypothetical protein
MGFPESDHVQGAFPYEAEFNGPVIVFDSRGIGAFGEADIGHDEMSLGIVGMREMISPR